jgi:hypothetical protein
MGVWEKIRQVFPQPPPGPGKGSEENPGREKEKAAAPGSWLFGEKYGVKLLWPY